MTSKTVALLAMGAAVGFVWWLVRPVAGGKRVVSVAGLRG